MTGEHSGRYVLDGHTPVPEPDLFKWGRWLEEARAERRVARDQIGEAEVSTVFLALDHAWTGDVPILFETMVFGGERDGDQARYSTWDEAEAGHRRIVDELRSALQ